MPDPDPRIELLRMSHPEAAEALMRINEVLQPAPPRGPDAAMGTSPTPPTTAEPLQAISADPGDAQRRAEGELLLAKLKKDTGFGGDDDGWTRTAA